MKKPLELPRGQNERKPVIKRHPDLPTGGRVREGQFKANLDLPEGSRERSAQIKDHADLPEGQRERSPQLKEHASLPEGGHERQATMKEFADLPQGSRERSSQLKEFDDLPQGSPERRSRFKEHAGLPEGSRERSTQLKEFADLPEGSRERRVQMKEYADLPQGGRERVVQLKEALTLPEGNRQSQAQFRENAALPDGDRQRSGPDFKENLDLPPEDNNEILSGGIRGLALPLNPVSRPLGFLSHVKNLIRSHVTAVETRPGRVAVGSTLGASRVLGLVPFYYGDAKTGVHQNKKLIAGSGSTWNVWDGSWATLKTGLSSNRKFEGAMMDDHLYLTNGADPVQVYDGTTIEDLAGSPPESPFIAQGYRRLFLVNLPHQVVVCNPADPTNWSTEDSASLTISGKDGDIITWIQFYGTNLYIWKRHALFELHGPAKGYVTANWRDFRTHKVGTPNGRTVANVAGTLFWLSDSDNSKGVVAWTGGGYPQVVSDPIKGIIDRINWGIISCASAGTDGHGNYLLSVPLDNATTPTHTLVYCTADSSWWVWENWVPTVYGQYRLHGYDESAILGDNNGTVYQIGGDDDAGTPIDWEAIIGPAVLGSATQEKRVRRAYIIASTEDPEVFTLNLGGATGGNYTLGHRRQMTGNIAYNASTATIQSALEAVYGAGNVTVTAGPTITFDVSVGASLLVADFSGLTGATSPALTQVPEQFNASTCPGDIGPFDDPVAVDLTNTRANRVKKYLPLNTGDVMGGYLYRMKLDGSGRNKLYEVGFEVGIRRV